MSKYLYKKSEFFAIKAIAERGVLRSMRFSQPFLSLSHLDTHILSAVGTLLNLSLFWDICFSHLWVFYLFLGLCYLAGENVLICCQTSWAFLAVLKTQVRTECVGLQLWSKEKFPLVVRDCEQTRKPRWMKETLTRRSTKKSTKRAFQEA